MNLALSVFAVDAHTTGSPIRVITGGIPTLRGKNISEKMEDMKKNYDHLRTCILQPPRGCPSLMCAVLTEPTEPDAHYGLFYMDAGGYQPMCGAGTMAVAKVLVENGMVPRTGTRTRVLFETGPGRVAVDVVDIEGRDTRIELENAPAFLYAMDQKVSVPQIGEIQFDLVFGGNFFALVDTAQLGFSICPETIPRMTSYMPQIVEAISRNFEVVHPENPAINYLNEMLFIQETQDPDGGYLGQAIFGNAQVDLSPCGTGTSGRMAQRYFRGRMGLGETFIHKQAYGGVFTGTLLRETAVGGKPAVIPRISCRDVQITGYNHLIAEAGDRLKYGFSY
jgi:proline racemase